LKAILCTTSTKQLHNAYYTNYSQLTICVQAANLSDCRIESKFFWSELECSTVCACLLTKVPEIVAAGIETSNLACRDLLANSERLDHPDYFNLSQLSVTAHCHR